MIDSARDEIQTAHTPVDMWRVEKKISTHISHERANAYNALVEQYHPGSDPSKGKDGSGDESKPLKGKDDLGKGPGRIAEAEEEFHRSMMDLISTILTKGGKFSGGHGVALASNVLQLVPTLPLNPVLMPRIDLPLEKECRIMSGETPRSLPLSHSTLSLLPSSPLTGSTSGPVSTARSAIQFGQAMIQPVTHVQLVIDYSFFKKPLPINVPAPPMEWKSPEASSTPSSKPPPKLSWEDLDKDEPTINLTEVDADETFTHHKGISSRSSHGSSK